MNHIDNLIWNRGLGAWQVALELATSRGGKGSGSSRGSRRRRKNGAAADVATGLRVCSGRRLMPVMLASVAVLALSGSLFPAFANGGAGGQDYANNPGGAGGGGMRVSFPTTVRNVAHWARQIAL